VVPGAGRDQGRQLALIIKAHEWRQDAGVMEQVPDDRA